MYKLSDTKDYYLIETLEDINYCQSILKNCEIIAFDTETDGVNVRKNKIIGYSFSTKVGDGYYFPLYFWDGEKLSPCPLLSHAKDLLQTIKTKKTIMHNGAFDTKITFNNFDIDLLENLHSDTMLMRHTINEEGPFALKDIAVELQEFIGIDSSEVANQEQLELEQSVLANGGVWKKTEKDIYKGDMKIIAKYACFAPNTTYVTTSNGGCKLIEDIEVGEEVIDHNGDVQVVYDILKQKYSGVVYDFELEVGRKLRQVTQDHRFLVLNQDTLKEEWVEAKNLKENDFLVRPNIKPSTSNIENNDLDFWWLFGLYQAEGYVRIQKNNKYPVFTVHLKEKKTVVDVINKLGYKCSVIKKGTSKAVDIVVTSSTLGELYLTLSGGKYKSYDKTITKDTFNYLLKNKTIGLSFLSGLFDGDAHYKQRGVTHNYSLNITSASLINIVDMLLTSYGINSTRGFYEPSKTSKGKLVQRKRRHSITIFSSEMSILLDYSKYKNFNKLVDYSPSFKKYVRIKKITKSTYEGLVHNIEVTNTHSYIANGIISHNCADTDLTIRLFYYFETQLAEQNLLDFFYVDEVMPLYKYVTVMMEFEGVYLDMPKLIAYNDEILSEIKNTKQFVISKIMSSSFSEALLEKLCEDYPISNKGSYAQTLCEFANLNLPKGSNGKYSLTKKSIEALEESVYKHFLLTGDVDLISIEDHKTISRMLLKKDEPDLINISSKQQLSILAFDVMGLEPLSKTDKGSPQFNEDFLETIKEDWAKELRVYNKLVKIQGSYYQRFLDQQENGVFYPTFKQFGTTSGRYGSDMQQLSRPMEEGSDDPRVIKYTNTLRKLFIPKPGYAFIDDDYESLEPRTFADDALDQPLIEIFEKGEDFYSKVAIQAENLKGLSADKKHPDFLKNKFPQVRQNAKAYALGIRYGMKAFKLAYSLNIDPVEAEKIIEGYFKAFPNLKKKMDQYINEAKTKGTVTSKYGRVRHLPRAKAIYEKYGDDILDHSKLVTLSKKYYKPVAYLKDLRKEFNNLLNNALNFPIQSAAASIVNRAMIAMTYKFREKGLDAWVSLQIHDQIVVTCHESCIDEVKAIVQDCMENTNKLAMKLVAKPEVAYNLADGH